MNYFDLLKIGLPTLSGVIASYVSYRIGKKTRIDETKIRKKFEFGEKVNLLFQQIVEINISLRKFYKSNFIHVESIHEAVEDLQTHSKVLYESQFKEIEDLINKKSELHNILKNARLYLNKRIIKNIEEYLELSKINYLHDGGFINTYLDELFKNLIDEKVNKKREKLRKTIMRKIYKLIP